jgi:hypothetical protein
MRRVLLVLLILSAVAAAGCGSSSHGASPGPTKVHFAKTKFALHAGLAFGVFHRWIYKPFKRDELQHPLRHKVAFAKALAAGAFVLHEIRLARADAAHSAVLSHVVVPLLAVASSVAVIHAALRHHRADASAINSANSSIGQAHSASSAAGQPIRETTAGAPI